MTLSPDSPIYVAGHTGMVGSALVRALRTAGHRNVVLRSSKELDLRDQNAVYDFLAVTRPSQVYLAAAKVGRIHANRTQPADFLHDNLAIQTNVIEGSRRAGVDKLLFLGSSCIYPKHAPQPIPEDALMTGELEPTNAPYAIAKIAGLHMCDAYRAQHGCNYISAMPTNRPWRQLPPGTQPRVAGNDSAFPRSQASRAACRHLLGHRPTHARIPPRGRPRAACLHLMNVHNEPGWVNVGTGSDVSIAKLATWWPTRWASRAKSSGTTASRTAHHGNGWMCPA